MSDAANPRRAHSYESARELYEAVFEDLANDPALASGIAPEDMADWKRARAYETLAGIYDDRIWWRHHPGLFPRAELRTEIIASDGLTREDVERMARGAELCEDDA